MLRQGQLEVQHERQLDAIKRLWEFSPEEIKELNRIEHLQRHADLLSASKREAQLVTMEENAREAARTSARNAESNTARLAKIERVTQIREANVAAGLEAVRYNRELDQSRRMAMFARGESMPSSRSWFSTPWSTPGQLDTPYNTRESAAEARVFEHGEQFRQMTADEIADLRVEQANDLGEQPMYNRWDEYRDTLIRNAPVLSAIVLSLAASAYALYSVQPAVIEGVKNGDPESINAAAEYLGQHWKNPKARAFIQRAAASNGVNDLGAGGSTTGSTNLGEPYWTSTPRRINNMIVSTTDMKRRPANHNFSGGKVKRNLQAFSGHHTLEKL